MSRPLTSSPRHRRTKSNRSNCGRPNGGRQGTTTISVNRAGVIAHFSCRPADSTASPNRYDKNESVRAKPLPLLPRRRQARYVIQPRQAGVRGALLRGVECPLGLAETLAGCIRDWRDPALVVHTLSAMLRFRMFAIACGYEDADFVLTVTPVPGLWKRAILNNFWSEAKPTGGSNVFSARHRCAAGGLDRAPGPVVIADQRQQPDLAGAHQRGRAECERGRISRSPARPQRWRPSP